MSATPTATSEAPAPSAGSAGSESRTARGWDGRRLRRAAGFAAVLGLGMLFVVLLALSAQRPTATLDPEGAGPEGGRALAEVLRSQGVEVEVVRSIGDLEDAQPDAGTTVFVGDPTNLGPGATARLADVGRATGRFVLAGVSTEQLRLLRVPVEAFPGGGGELVARCRSEIAREPDVVSAWDTRYVPTGGGPGTRSCFVLPSDDGPPDQPDPAGAFGAVLVELDEAGERPATVVTGLGPAWTNELITNDSHAGTAVRALGATPRLVWYQPGTTDLVAPGPDGTTSTGDLSVWPAWAEPAVALLLSAVVLLALARGRRLGRLVREPLPVVVRAIETTESRGRLYRRAGDRARAAAVLRSGTTERLARRLAVGRGAPPGAVVHAAALVTGRPAGEVADILFGPPPPDDPALIQLAQQLTDLEERVRHP